MKKGKKLYEGKAKVIFATDNKDFVIQHSVSYTHLRAHET